MSVPPTDNNESLLDLPPVAMPQGAESNIDAQEPVKQQGTEVNPEFLPAQPAAQNDPTVALQPVVAPVTNAAHDDLTAQIKTDQSGAAASQIADDVDLIEKEWVDRAKDIVNKTKHDPKLQSQELNKVKADYIKQRFNKDLRT